MKKILFLVFAAAVICLMQLSFVKPDPLDPVAEEVRQYILRELKDLTTGLASVRNNESREQLRDHYMKLRRSYKHIEFFVEYYSPREAKFFINGPLVPKHDEDN
jgi:cytochrome c peroxidase